MKKIGIILIGGLLVASSSFAGLCKINVIAGMAGTQVKDFTVRDLGDCLNELAQAHVDAMTSNPDLYKKSVMKFYENSNFGDLRLFPDVAVTIRRDGTQTWKTSNTQSETP